MSDESQIVRLRELYATHFDGRDADSFITLFALDGTLVLPGGKEMTGHDRLARLIVSVPANGGKHIPMDAEILVTGDEASCNGPYRMEMPDSVSTGRYDDRFVRTADGWRFARRVILPDA